MANFDTGETVICSITVKDASGDLQDAATTMKIEIKVVAPIFSTIVSSTNMTNDSTGTYHYDYTSTGAARGDYEITYTATDGSRITKEVDTFSLV